MPAPAAAATNPATQRAGLGAGVITPLANTTAMAMISAPAQRPDAASTGAANARGRRIAATNACRVGSSVDAAVTDASQACTGNASNAIAPRAAPGACGRFEQTIAIRATIS